MTRLPGGLFGRDPQWEQRFGWGGCPGTFSTQAVLHTSPATHRVRRVIDKRSFTFDGRASSTQTLEIDPAITLGSDTAAVLLVVRVHATTALTATASCVVGLHNASLNVDGEPLIENAAQTWVALDDSTIAPALLLAEMTSLPAQLALVLAWSQGATAATGDQEVVLSVDVVERFNARTPAATVIAPAAHCSAPPISEMQRAPSPVLFEALPKQTFSFDVDTKQLQVPLATRIPAVDFIDATLVVRVHDISNFSDLDSCDIRLLNESVTREERTADFVDRANPLASVTIDNTVTAPTLLMDGAARTIGIADHLRVELAYSSTGTDGSPSVTIDADVILRSRRRLFKPIDVDGCLLWLRSDLDVTVTDGKVSGWGDQSGLGNHGTQATAGLRPTYEVAGWKGTLPALDFVRANNGGIDLPTSMSDASNAYTLLVALDQRSETTYPQDVLSTDTVSPAWLFTTVAQGSAEPGIYDGSWRGCGSAAAAGEQVLAWRVGVTSGSPTFECFRDGASIGSAAWSGSVSWTNPRFGRLGASLQAIDAQVAEVVLYNRALDDDELATVNQYLMLRYTL